MIQERSRKQEVEKDLQKYMYHPFLQCNINVSSHVEEIILARNRWVTPINHEINQVTTS